MRFIIPGKCRLARLGKQVSRGPLTTVRVLSFTVTVRFVLFVCLDTNVLRLSHWPKEESRLFFRIDLSGSIRISKCSPLT
jgi:hypothetical protein